MIVGRPLLPRNLCHHRPSACRTMRPAAVAGPASAAGPGEEEAQEGAGEAGETIPVTTSRPREDERQGEREPLPATGPRPSPDCVSLRVESWARRSRSRGRSSSSTWLLPRALVAAVDLQPALLLHPHRLRHQTWRRRRRRNEPRCSSPPPDVSWCGWKTYRDTLIQPWHPPPPLYTQPAYRASWYRARTKRRPNRRGWPPPAP